MTQDYTTPPPPTAKKRNMKVAALAAICIILAASLVGVGALYMLKPSNNSDLTAQLAQRDATIASLNATLNGSVLSNASSSTYLASIAVLTSQLSATNSQLSDANSEIADLQNIVNLNYTDNLVDSQVFDQQLPNTSDIAYSDLLQYAGILQVTLQSNSTTTYAETFFTYAGQNFSFNQTIGTSGFAIFLVLPTETTIRIGNLETTNTNNATVTIDYFY